MRSNIEHDFDNQIMTSNKESSSNLEQLRSYMNSFPLTLDPVFSTDQPNQAIVLYQGNIKLSKETTEIEGLGTIEYRWTPYPSIKFKFELLKEISGSVLTLVSSNDRSVSITLSDLQITVDGYLEDYSIGGDQGNKLSGRTTQPIVQEKTKDLVHVIFHVANFHKIVGNEVTLLKKASGELKTNSNRIIFEAEDWKITFDQLETPKDNIDRLKNERGFAITHVGKLEKLDGTAFSGDEANKFFVKFADFLSFVRGFRVPVLLFVGYDANNDRVWEYWNSSGGSSWQGVNSWCPTEEAVKLVKLLPGFLDWWQKWDESERIALYWYLEANSVSSIEQTIILTQVALELISWVVLVEKEKTISMNGFDKLPASDKLRILLSRFRIPLNLPPKISPLSPSLAASFIPKRHILQDLVNLASEKNNKWVDGLHAFTEMRNGLVHPKKNKREKIHNSSFKAKHEASDLGLWYLELIFLAMFDYQENYANRLIKPRQNGETELVPWNQN